MLFNSLTFLVFLPLFLLAYYATTRQFRLWICLIGSYIFYGWWDWRFLALVLFATVVDYSLGLAMASSESPGRRKLLLCLSIITNLGFLSFFKYFNFFVASLAAAFDQLGVNWNFRHLAIILPIGISFYTFQSMSYTIDVYRRRIAAERSLLRFATFIAFFPQLVAGPIVRAERLLPQFREDHPFDWERWYQGWLLVIWGYFLKIGIADSLALVVDTHFDAPEVHGSLALLIAVVFYAFQIYCDFAGYSSIAIGLARVLGFDFGVNFDRPYFSASFSEFWTRWHISLSSWLRDYLYIPLGGNRHGPWRTLRNLMVTMLLAGLWHGAAWHFVVWGGLHGIYLVVQRSLAGVLEPIVRAVRLPPSLYRALCVGVVFSLTCVGWVFFRADNCSVAWEVLSRIASFEGFSFAEVGNKFHVVKGLALIAFLCLAEATSFVTHPAAVLARRPSLAWGAACVLLWGLALTGTFGSNAFIYFQF